MIRLTVRVVGTHKNTGNDVELVKIESTQYNPEELVRRCLTEILSGAPQRDHGFSKSGTLQIGIELFAEPPDLVRPSLHLDIDTIRKLHDADAELDFDPYVYTTTDEPAR